MNSLLTFFTCFLRHDVFLTSWQTFGVMACFWYNDKHFDIMTCFLMWCTFDIMTIVDVITNFLTSCYVFDVIIFLNHPRWSLCHTDEGFARLGILWILVDMHINARRHLGFMPYVIVVCGTSWVGHCVRDSHQTTTLVPWGSLFVSNGQGYPSIVSQLNTWRKHEEQVSWVYRITWRIDALLNLHSNKW